MTSTPSEARLRISRGGSTRAPMSDLDPDEWQKKGATLSDKTARKEFDLTQTQIVAAIRAGDLHHREAQVAALEELRAKLIGEGGR